MKFFIAALGFYAIAIIGGYLPLPGNIRMIKRLQSARKWPETQARIIESPFEVDRCGGSNDYYLRFEYT